MDINACAYMHINAPPRGAQGVTPEVYSHGHHGYKDGANDLPHKVITVVLPRA